MLPAALLVFENDTIGIGSPQGEALWTRTVTAWRSFPSRLPLSVAALLIVANVALLGLLVVRKNRVSAARID